MFLQARIARIIDSRLFQEPFCNIFVKCRAATIKNKSKIQRVTSYNAAISIRQPIQSQPSTIFCIMGSYVHHKFICSLANDSIFKYLSSVMAENQKSGQKIKTKVSKSTFAQNNTSKISKFSNNQSTPLYQNDFPFLSLIVPKAQKENKTEQLDVDKQEEDVFKHFGIPENFSFNIRERDGYSQNLCRERISAFQSKKNLELDVRDDRVRVPFQSQYLGDYVRSGCIEDMEPLLDEIRDWLVDLIQITCSVSFNHVKQGSLSQLEGKNFAAKNMLVNIKEMFETLNLVPIEQRFHIMKHLNTEMQKVIQNVIMKYPQTHSKGASRRIKSKIRRIDNREDDHYDFLFRNGLNVFYRKSGDYSQDILKIVNRLISISTDPFNPNSDCEDTNFEVFTEIMQHIFQNSGSQSVDITVTDIAEIVNRKKRAKGESFIFNSTNVTQIREAFSFSERVEKRSNSIRDLSSKDYLIGHKIPSGTPLFSDQQVQGGCFKVPDSSVLRILTKWAEELREKVQNAEESISKRVHKFKTKNGKFVNLEASLKDRLFFSAQEEEHAIREYMEFLNKENTALQIIFAQENNIGKYSKHDTKVGVFAAKINEVASQYTFRYVNKLIHALLKLPRTAAGQLSNESDHKLLASLNLLTLKVGDLMRCKYSCSQQEFLKILSVLEEMDCRYPQIFKIVRIKNRLDQKDNDLLINLFFAERVQCELQLSIKGLYNKMEKDFSAFNHFLYEILRSKLGPISELANIVTQYDPLIHHFKRMNQFGPQLLEVQWVKGRNKEMLEKLTQKLKFKKEFGVLQSIELPFICCKCFCLTNVANPRLFYRSSGNLMLTCNSCCFIELINNCNIDALSHFIFQSFRDEQTKAFFSKHIKHWDVQKQIKLIEDDKDPQSCRMLNIPHQGFFIRKSSKNPKLSLYSATFESVSSSYFLASVDEKANKKIVANIPFYLEKKKRVNALKKELDGFYFFSFRQTKSRKQNGVLYLSCASQGCCGKQVKVGSFLSPKEIVEIVHEHTISSSLNSQKNLINLSSMPNSLQKVEQFILTIDDQYKSERVGKSIQHLNIMRCSLENIQTLPRFVNLTDLNVSDNPQLKSLKGLEECHQLVNLQCMNCDLQNIDELRLLKRIECLNLKNNRKLKNINGLKDHTHLIDLNIARSSVDSLDPLEKCLKLESLSIQECREITSLSSINSTKLTYLNLVECTGLQLLDLQIKSTKSLKTIRYVRNNRQKIGLELILASLNFLELDEGDGQNSDDNPNSMLNLDKINQVLRSNRKRSTQKMLSLP